MDKGIVRTCPFDPRGRLRPLGEQVAEAERAWSRSHPH